MRVYTELEKDNLIYWLTSNIPTIRFAQDELVGAAFSFVTIRTLCACGALPCRHVLAIDQDGENGPWLFICDAAHGEHSFEFQTDTNDFPLAVMLFAKELFTRYPVKKC